MIIAALLLSAPLAFAGTGQGSVSCNSGDRVVALYSWFHSDADSYSNLNIFVQDADGNFKQYSANNEEALKALSVKTSDGQTIVVTPDLQASVCTIK